VWQARYRTSRTETSSLSLSLSLWASFLSPL
jgi:hypothetical protein